ncbi:MAG: hypothetical protein R2848_08825 [Thermomicrobiales bacterium]
MSGTHTRDHLDDFSGTERGLRRAIVPADDAPEAALIGGIDVIAVRTLADVVNYLNGELPIRPFRPQEGLSDRS